MFNFLLLLLGFGTVKSSTKYFLCDTPKMEAYYEMCDDSFPPVIKLEGCDLSRHTHGNISMKVIPRKNIDRLYATVEIWKESVTVSVTKVELCTGVDDEFDFCGALKGETLTILHQRKLFKRLQLVEGEYTLKAQLLVGEKRELLMCILGIVKIKAALM
ncbi:lymphocyte antigen 96 isoform X2 [Ranitomeya variabilis]|uniref:lymphocyte antigen 96 isoform X2 n=1 Tax=Ranitomeya variabilis TaxID=490064 RepID=UPI004055D869